MRCKHCNYQIKNSDLYCPKCRKKTQSIKENFLIWDTFKQSYKEIKESKNYSFTFNLFYAIITLIFLALLGFHYFSSNYSSDLTRYLYENAIFLVFVPILLVPFGIQNVIMEIGYGKELNSHIFKIIPKYILFVLVNIVIFALFRFLCTGDHVLRLVRVILVLWWLAVLLPIPVMLTKYKMNLYKLIRLSLRAFEDLRWQMFFGYILIAVLNIAMIIPLFLGYLRFGSLPYYALTKYVDKIDDNGLLKLSDKKK